MPTARSFPSVRIISGATCCEAARAAATTKLLASQASRVPLSDCTLPAECRCRFEKHKDRRGDDDDRRLPGTVTRTVWYGGEEKRKSRSRRREDES